MGYYIHFSWVFRSCSYQSASLMLQANLNLFLIVFIKINLYFRRIECYWTNRPLISFILGVQWKRNYWIWLIYLPSIFNIFTLLILYHSIFVLTTMTLSLFCFHYFDTTFILPVLTFWKVPGFNPWTFWLLNECHEVNLENEVLNFLYVIAVAIWYILDAQKTFYPYLERVNISDEMKNLQDV